MGNGVKKVSEIKLNESLVQVLAHIPQEDRDALEAHITNVDFTLGIMDREMPSGRLGACNPERTLIYFSPRTISFPPRGRRLVVAHELGRASAHLFSADVFECPT